MTLLKIAFRNVLKNRRRSLITVLAIGFGFMAVAMFKGYTHQAYQKIALGAIYVENPGHVTVFKKGFLQEGKLDPEKYLFTPAELQTLTATARKNDAVVWTAPRLCITGLVSNGKSSTIFLADAMDPAKEKELWGHYRFRQWMTPKLLPLDDPNAIFLGPELVELLGLRERDTVVLSATTQYGQMNAVDGVVYGSYTTFNDAMNDKYARLPLGLAQTLYDTEGADRLCVLCEEVDDAPAVAAYLEEGAARLGVPVEVKTWDELSLYYGKAKNFLDVVFAFLFSITGLIVVLSTVNTMSMSIYERFREIGTLRAIGLKAQDAVRLFAFEGALLGLLGGMAGLVFTVVGSWAVGLADIRYKPPGMAEAVSIEVDLIPATLAMSFACFVLLSVVSAVLPARRASRQPIVEALGHV